MVKGGLVPCLLAMARPAFLAFLTFVLVVFLMTRETVARQLVLIQIALVAARALGRLVLAQQRILGLLVVIEGCFLPIFLDVTSLALRPEIALVFIILLMA